MPIDYALTGLKLKIWHQSGRVSVFQEGSATDPDVTSGYRFDDFWRTGTNIGSSREAAKIGIELDGLSFGTESPAEFSFVIHDRIVNSYLDVDLWDRVELFADVGDTLTETIGVFPAWHLNNQAGQVCIFYGRITSKRPRFAAEGREAFEITARDPRAYADDVRIVRDLAGGIAIPHLIVNADTDERNWIASLKKTNAPAWPTHPTFGFGVPATDGGKLTIRDVLAYLGDEYATELTSAGVKASGVDLFHDDDLEALTTELPKLDFVGVGFYEAVRRVLSFAPDYSLTVDPKTTQWRIYLSRHLLRPGEVATSTSWTDGGSSITLGVDDASIFSATPGDAGNYVLLVDADDSRFSYYALITAVGASTIEFAPPGHTFPTGSRVYPLEPYAAQLPVIGVDLKAGVLSADLEEKLDGVYTAVRITAFTQTTEKKTVTRSSLVANILPAWDDGFEANWNIDKGDREEDNGYDGLGVVVYDHAVVAGFSRIAFVAGTSQYGNAHDIVAGVSEWKDCAFHMLISDGADVASASPRIASRITAMSYSASIDGAGTPGYYVTLAHDLTTHPSGPGTVYSTVSPGLNGPDRFKITHNLGLSDLDGARAAARLNANYEVFRKWGTSSTTQEVIQTEAASCGGYAQISGIAGVNQAPIATYNPAAQAAAATGAPMTFQELNDFWSKRVGSGNFLTRGFFLKKPAQDPSYQNCAATAPPAPPKVEIEYTTEKLECREVRVPETGFSGLAEAMYGLEREFIISADRFERDDQAALYEDIARAMFRDVSEPNHDGTLTVHGLRPWLNLADLAARVRLTNFDWTYWTASVSYINKFRAPLARIAFDFRSATTSLGFSTRDAFGALETRTLEDLYVREPEKKKDTVALFDNVAKARECLNRPAAPAIPSAIPSCRIQYPSPDGGPSRGGGKLPPVPPKQEGQGTNESSVGLPLAVTAAGKNWQNKGPNADGVIERDYLGGLWFWSMDYGQPMQDNGDGTAYLLDGSTKRYTALPQFNRDRIKELAAAVLGADVAYTSTQLHARIGSGSTTTVIAIDNPGLTTNELAGGTLEIVGEEGQVRPLYSIASNTTGTVTLTGAMAEAAPVAGAVAVLRGPGLHPLDATDFPDGGTLFEDTAANLFVITPNGAIVSALLNSGTIEEKTSSPNSPVLNLGQAGLTLEAQGTVDFASATVTGIETGFTDPNGHYSGDETSLPDVLAELGWVLEETTRSWLGAGAFNCPRFWNQAESAFISGWGYGRTCTPTGSTTIAFKAIPIPAWAKANGSTMLTVAVTWTVAATPGSAKNWVLRVALKAFDIGDGDPASGLTSTDTSIAVDAAASPNVVYRDVVNITTPDIYSGSEEFVFFALYRRGDDGADDYASSISVLGIDLSSGVERA